MLRYRFGGNSLYTGICLRPYTLPFLSFYWNIQRESTVIFLREMGMDACLATTFNDDEGIAYVHLSLIPRPHLTVCIVF